MTRNDISQRFYGGALGGLFLMNFSGISNQPLSPSTGTDDIRGLAATNQYAIGVGKNGLLIQPQAQSWTRIPGAGSTNLNAVAARGEFSGHFAIAVGDGGIIYWIDLGPDVPM